MQSALPVAFKAQETVEKARVLLESGRGSALPELVKLIATLTTDFERVNISELVETIEPDPVLLTRILAAANKLPFNPGISRVATLGQAIHQIGFARVRNTALSLLLLDQTRDQSAPEVREAAALALTSGLIAQGVSAHLGTHDPELAFACAALRNLGRVLMAALSPPLYREALALARREPGADGFRRYFGLSPLELSRRLTATHQLPDSAAQTLRDGEPEALPGVRSSHDGRLLALCDYACRLGQLTLEPSEPDHDFVRQAVRLGARYRRVLPDIENAAAPALLGANTRLRDYVRGGVADALPLAKLKRIRHRAELLAPGAAAAAERAEVLPVRYTAAGLTDPAGAPPLPEAPAGLDASSAGPTTTPAPLAAPTMPAEDTSVPLSLETLKPTAETTATAGFDTLDLLRTLSGATEVWWFRADQPGVPLTPHRGLGSSWPAVPPAAEVRPGERSLCGLALAKDEIVLIHDLADPLLATYLPTWWSTLAVPPCAFALVPIHHGPVTSLLLLGWLEKRRVRLTPPQATLIRQLAGAAG